MQPLPQLSEQEVQFCSKVLLGQHRIISDAEAKVKALQAVVGEMQGK